jgi:hypothetical protein
MTKEEREKLKSQRTLVNFWIKHIRYGHIIPLWQKIKDSLFPRWVTVVDKDKKYCIKNPYFKRCHIVGLCETPVGEPLEVSIVIDYEAAKEQQEEFHNYADIDYS